MSGIGKGIAQGMIAENKARKALAKRLSEAEKERDRLSEKYLNMQKDYYSMLDRGYVVNVTECRCAETYLTLINDGHSAGSAANIALGEKIKAWYGRNEVPPCCKRAAPKYKASYCRGQMAWLVSEEGNGTVAYFGSRGEEKAKQYAAFLNSLEG